MRAQPRAARRALRLGVGVVVGEARGAQLALALACRHRNWSVKTYAELVAVGAAVRRGSVSSSWWFNMQNGSFESGEKPVN